MGRCACNVTGTLKDTQLPMNVNVNANVNDSSGVQQSAGADPVSNTRSRTATADGIAASLNRCRRYLYLPRVSAGVSGPSNACSFRRYCTQEIRRRALCRRCRRILPLADLSVTPGNSESEDKSMFGSADQVMAVHLHLVNWQRFVHGRSCLLLLYLPSGVW